MQNSVQQHLTTNAAFLKTPRRSDEPGKGNFWLLDHSRGLVFDGISDESGDEGPAKAKPAPAPAASTKDKRPPKPAVSKPRQTIKINAKQQQQALQKVQVHGNQSLPVPPSLPLSTSREPEMITVSIPVNSSSYPHTNGTSSSSYNSTTLSPAPIASTSALPSLKRLSPQPPPSSPAPAAATTSASPLPNAPPPVKTVRIIVGPIPPDYKPPPSQLKREASDDVAAQLLKDPPIVLYEGALILSPAIFGMMKPDQITALSRLGVTKALSILQSYIVQHVRVFLWHSYITHTNRTVISSRRNLRNGLNLPRLFHQAKPLHQLQQFRRLLPSLRSERLKGMKVVYLLRKRSHCNKTSVVCSAYFGSSSLYHIRGMTVLVRLVA